MLSQMQEKIIQKYHIWNQTRFTATLLPDEKQNLCQNCNDLQVIDFLKVKK